MGKKGRGKGKGKKQRKMAALLAAQAPALEPAFAVGQAADGAGAERLDEPVDRPPGSTELAARLASISTVLQRHIARADAGAGLTRARLSALTLLVLGGPRTLGDLAAAERVRPPTMTRLVHAMEADGLVVRERNPADGRSIIIRASRLGEEQLEQGRARQLAPLADAIAGLGPDQRRQLDDAAGLLGRVLRASESESRRTE